MYLGCVKSNYIINMSFKRRNHICNFSLLLTFRLAATTFCRSLCRRVVTSTNQSRGVACDHVTRRHYASAMFFLCALVTRDLDRRFQRNSGRKTRNRRTISKRRGRTFPPTEWSSNRMPRPRSVGGISTPDGVCPL